MRIIGSMCLSRNLPSCLLLPILRMGSEELPRTRRLKQTIRTEVNRGRSGATSHSRVQTPVGMDPDFVSSAEPGALRLRCLASRHFKHKVLQLAELSLNLHRAW